MLKNLLSLLKDESGTTMLEYAVVGGNRYCRRNRGIP